MQSFSAKSSAFTDFCFTLQTEAALVQRGLCTRQVPQQELPGLWSGTPHEGRGWGFAPARGAAPESGAARAGMAAGPGEEEGQQEERGAEDPEAGGTLFLPQLLSPLLPLGHCHSAGLALTLHLRSQVGALSPRQTTPLPARTAAARAGG